MYYSRRVPLTDRCIIRRFLAGKKKCRKEEAREGKNAPFAARALLPGRYAGGKTSVLRASTRRGKDSCPRLLRAAVLRGRGGGTRCPALRVTVFRSFVFTGALVKPARFVSRCYARWILDD